MSDKASIILKQLGLNDYEIKAYLTLVAASPLSAPEISSASEIPSPRVYDIMDSLSKKGFVKIVLGMPTTYQAVGPEEALSNYKRKIQLELRKRTRGVDEMQADLVNLLGQMWQKNVKLTKPRDVFSVKDDDDILVTLEDMFLRAEGHVRMLVDLPMSRMLFRMYEHTLEELAVKGVDIKILTPKNGDTAIESMKKFAEIKEITDPSPSTYCLADSELLLIEDYIANSETICGRGVWTNSSVLVNVFSWSFDRLWEERKK